MDIRQITPDYFVAPQLDPSEMGAAAEAGFTRIIANRPDGEVPPSHQADAMETAARAAGIDFVRLPLTHQTMTLENVALHADAIASAGGKVLAYCASGTRSTVIWCLAEAKAGNRPIDEILAQAQAGGYELGHLRPMLEEIAKA